MDSLDVPRSVVNQLIDEWIFSERDRAICRRRILDGIKYEPLAEEFGLSVQQTKTIVCKCRTVLQKHMDN